MARMVGFARAGYGERDVDELRLSSDILDVVIDVGRGADIVSMRYRPTDLELLFQTPWRVRADDIRSGRTSPTSTEDVARWLEQYRGGWQTLCPNSGAPRTRNGAPLGFHGEASTVRWQALSTDDASCSLELELFTVPLRIHRDLELRQGRLTQTDTLTNLSRIPLDLDYSSHPALSTELLAGGGRLDIAADTFVVDHDSPPPGLTAGSRHKTPWILDSTTGQDLSMIPPAGVPRTTFGYFTDFVGGYASVRASGLTIAFDWDANVLPHAWLWQEFEATESFPWFGRARTMAIEPASTPTSGPGRGRSLSLPPYGDARIDLSVTVEAELPDKL